MRQGSRLKARQEVGEDNRNLGFKVSKVTMLHLSVSDRPRLGKVLTLKIQGLRLGPPG